MHSGLDDILCEIPLQDNSKKYLYFSVGRRKISSPDSELRGYQYKIKEYLEKNSYISIYATGYRKKMSIRDNALIHKNAKYILIVDIKGFFKNITTDMLYSYFKEYNIKNINKLISIISNKGSLPQGAPSSPIISNILFSKIDNTIAKYLKKISTDITYSRYVDDIAIGFNQYDSRYDIFIGIQKILLNSGFQINKEKLRLYDEKKKRMVTGMIISKEHVGVGYKYYRTIKKALFKYLKYGTGYFPIIKGHLLYIKGVDYYRYNQLLNYYITSYRTTDKFKELFGLDEFGNIIVKEPFGLDEFGNDTINKLENKFIHKFAYKTQDYINKQIKRYKSRSKSPIFGSDQSWK